MAHPIHLFHEIVRFEDVDAAAMVYHPVFLNYIERARSQRLIDAGYSFKHLLENKLGLVVGSVEMKYVKPLRLEDRFVVASQIDDVKNSVVMMTQAIAPEAKDFARTNLKSELRQIERLHFFAHIKLVIISQQTMQPIPIPEWLLQILN